MIHYGGALQQKRHAPRVKGGAMTPDQKLGIVPITIPEAAKIFRCRPATLLDLARKGEIRAYLPPGQKRGMQVFYPQLIEDLSVSKNKMGRTDEGRQELRSATVDGAGDTQEQGVGIRHPIGSRSRTKERRGKDNTESLVDRYRARVGAAAR